MQELIEYGCLSTAVSYLITSKDNIIVDNSYTEAQAQDYCFVENVDINELRDNISKIYVYKWNRKYPSDVTFPAAMLDNYQLEMYRN